MKRTLALALPLAMIGSFGAHAQDVRYQLQRTDDGYARINTQTGEVSTCTERGDQLVCRMAADERAALLEEVAALEERLAALEGGRGPTGLPGDDDVDRALSLMERFMRGFVGIVRDLDDQEG